MRPDIQILDATPQMADVVSGAFPQPRERRSDEEAIDWLVGVTPIWPRVLSHFNISERAQWPGVECRLDLQPPASLGLGAFPHVYELTWHHLLNARAVLLLVNEDGTRGALVDIVNEIARLWDATRRPAAGRPRIETNNPRTLAQRKWRDKQK